MKILGVFHAYPPSHGAGAEWMAHSLFRALIEAGHQVRVVLSRDDQVTEGYQFDGVDVIPYGYKGTLIEQMPWPDVMVTHLENTPRASIVARLNGKPVVHLLHNTFGPTKGWVRTGRPSLLVFNTAWMQADYHGWLDAEGLRRPPGIVVHPPVYAADYATTPGDCVTLVNLTEAKGAEVFYGLAERFPKVPFLAVAGGYGEQIIRRLPNVTHTPNTDNMRDDVYAKTRILLAPSSYESFGRAGVEAMHSGIPVIAHPTPGLIESLGDAGLFADRGYLYQWQDALTLLLDGRRWNKASRLASERAAQLDPAPDLARFVAGIEHLQGVRA